MLAGFLKVLFHKCPHLHCLSLHMADLLLITMASLPHTLRHLEMHRCDTSLV